MMRANIGKAVMAMAAPRNSEACSNCAFSEYNPGMVISQGASRNASANGTTMPASETDIALL